MDINTGKYIEELYHKLTHNNYIRPEDLPDIDLYMDQVTTFMDAKLNDSKRHPDDKIFTKTMINNYAKNHLLPAPVKKKYSKEHLLLLALIYYLKNMLSISDIQTLLKPLQERYVSAKGNISLEEVYRQIFDLVHSQSEELSASLQKKLDNAATCFTDVPEDEQEYLQLAAFIGSLCYEVYIKQQLIERLIDDMISNMSEAPKKEAPEQ